MPTTTRSILTWHFTGAAFAVIVLAAVVLLDSWLDGSLPHTSLILELRNLAWTCVVFVMLTPVAALVMFAWLRLARRFPVVETSVTLRAISLATLAVVLFLVFAVLWGAYPGGSSIRYSADYVYSDLKRVGVAANLLWFSFPVAWLLGPRMVLPSLRKPLIWQ